MPRVLAVISPSPQLFYAFTLGMLAAFNPCGFPLLPAYLEFFTGSKGKDGALYRAGRAVAAGAFSTLGFVVLFGVVGAVVELGWSTVADHAVTAAHYVMVAVGVSMAAVGVAWLLRRPLRIRLPEVRPGLGLRRPAALFVFGVSYAVASIGCALPLFVSGVASTFSSADPAAGVEVFVSYALGMGAVLGTMAMVVAVMGPAAARTFRPLSRFVPPVGAALLVVVGLYLAVYWMFALVSPTSTFPVEAWVTAAQTAIVSFVGANARLVAVVAGALVVGALLAGGLFGYRSSSGRSSSPVTSSPVTSSPVTAEPRLTEVAGLSDGRPMATAAREASAP